MTDTRNVTDEPSGAERFELYRLCECTTCEGTGKEPDWVRATYGERVELMRCTECRGEGRTHELIATATDPQSVGVALVTLAREDEWADGCPFGLLDTQGEKGHKWLIKPWEPSTRNVTDAAKLLRSQQGKGK